MKLLARVGGEEGSGTKAVDKIGAPVSPLSVAFFRFLARDFLLEFLGAKKNCGELSCWTPYLRRGAPTSLEEDPSCLVAYIGSVSMA